MEATSRDIVQVKFRGRAVPPHKAILTPVIGAPNVLTNSPWTYVALWLKRGGKDKALLYWQQAQEFHKVSLGLAPQSAPLLLYYSFLNATKALLSAKAIVFNERHGVSEHTSGSQRGSSSLNHLGIRIQQHGVLPSLSSYYQETEANRTHTLQELFFNMVFIHRTYCLTYTSQSEMFIPIANCGFVADRPTKQVYFRADITKNVPFGTTVKRLPALFVADERFGPRAIRSVDSVTCQRPGKLGSTALGNVADLNRRLRRELFFINGTEPLWYIRSRTRGPKRIERQLPTLILGAMHRLSEISRYNPPQMASLLAGQKNWLLSEFIQMSAEQFIDEIASELTGVQFLVPNIRAAS
ncbi:hypothetical protein I6F33_00040 [Bradyrhizobium sp. BRP20]|uniref:YaaC family protein n=1 Tax=Bradyrhizobium sp. BRP20 TaxID=2793822 RepID=UPI001CD3ADA4|nr:YaaC family protein [Bradyrhizobium sp. BRP20]MCA1431354.1 hypothetical protein [Bradyrhizobium sp. BRP20]